MPSKARAKTATPNRGVGHRGVAPLSTQERLERDADLGWMAELAASDYRKRGHSLGSSGEKRPGHSLGASPPRGNGVADAAHDFTGASRNAAHDSAMSPGHAKWIATKSGRSGGSLGTGGQVAPPPFFSLVTLLQVLEGP